MTSIVKVIAVPGVGSGYCEDLSALQSTAISASERFAAPPVTPGFLSAREIAEVVSVGLVLEASCTSCGTKNGSSETTGDRSAVERSHGRVVWGDCAAVAYSGVSGRDAPFRSAVGLATIRSVVAPVLEGGSLGCFRQLSTKLDSLTEATQIEVAVPDRLQPDRARDVSRRDLLTTPARILQTARGEVRPVETVTVQRRLHSAIHYGVSQALLQAVSVARGLTMAEVIADEWNLPLPDQRIPIHAQSGCERFSNADKMIARRIVSMPHALVDDIPRQFGADGSELTRYIRWLRGRIDAAGHQDYRPVIHLDVHGALGHAYDNELGAMLGQLYAWEIAARPYHLRIESPMILSSRDAQIEAMKTLREYIQFRKMDVRLVADEWANTLSDIKLFVAEKAADMIHIKMPDLGGLHNSVDAVLACQAGDVDALLGGSCVETAVSSTASAHVALATRPALLMAKPGMGVDEAFSLVDNEMARALATIACR